MALPALVVAALPALLSKLVDKGGEIIDRVVPDKAAAEKAKLALAEKVNDQDFQRDMQQMLINLADAQSGKWWQAGWRPACGWIGAFALGYAAIIEPFARFVAKVGFEYDGEFPAIDTTITMQILVGILGLGAARSFDKSKGAK